MALCLGWAYHSWSSRRFCPAGSSRERGLLLPSLLYLAQAIRDTFAVQLSDAPWTLGLCYDKSGVCGQWKAGFLHGEEGYQLNLITHSRKSP